MKIGRWKKLLAILGVFLLIALPAVGEENNSISIQLNGQPLYLTDSNAMLVDGRVFVPFRAVFEGLEAEVNYDAEKNEINASRDGRKITMNIGNPVIKLHLNGVDTVVNTDAPSFIHNGRTYIPVRFAAQALDCKVGWDQERQVVIILDTAKIAADKDEYKLMEKLDAYSQKMTQGNRGVAGNIFLVMSDSNNNTKNVKINLTGTSNQQRTSLQMKVEPDTMSLAHNLLIEYGHLSNEGEQLLQTMENIEANLIIDWEHDKLYVQSELAAVLGEGMAATWYQLDGKECLGILKRGSKIPELIDSLLADLPLADSVAAATLVDSVEMLRAAYSDTSFVQQGNQYISKFTDWENGVKLEIETALFMNNQQINGYSSKVSVLEDKTNWEYFLQEEEQNLVIKMNLSDETMCTELSGKIEYKAIAENPEEIPDEFILAE